MPLSFDGAGTITGLQVGGLPDGTIDSDTLATDAVTVPKIGYNGAILQVVSATTSTQVTNTTASYADTGLTDSITPVAAGSSILVLTSLGFFITRASDNEGVRFQLVRGSTVIFGADAADNYANIGGASRVDMQGRNSMAYLDTPTYTLGDAITYKVQFKPNSSEARAQSGGANSSIVLLEVAG